mmetsp:Transcript_24735/g.46207  ORF Transcript_24735/g.46207 Transcript_24735/m.46207 type:complete len:216 (-) Transcript_24735:162-809(-)
MAILCIIRLLLTHAPALPAFWIFGVFLRYVVLELLLVVLRALEGFRAVPRLDEPPQSFAAILLDAEPVHVAYTEVIHRTRMALVRGQLVHFRRFGWVSLQAVAIPIQVAKGVHGLGYPQISRFEKEVFCALHVFRVHHALSIASSDMVISLRITSLHGLLQAEHRVVRIGRLAGALTTLQAESVMQQGGYITLLRGLCYQFKSFKFVLFGSNTMH